MASGSECKMDWTRRIRRGVSEAILLSARIHPVELHRKWRDSGTWAYVACLRFASDRSRAAPQVSVQLQLNAVYNLVEKSQQLSADFMLVCNWTDPR